MSGYKLILVGIALVLIAGVVFPFFAGFFINVDEISPPSLIDIVVDVIDNGMTLDVIPIVGWGEFHINPFSWLGSDLQDYISDSFTYLGLFPNIVLYPLVIFIALCFMLGIVSIIRGN